MSTMTRTRLTLDRFLARSETEPASEYACGEVYRKPMPNTPHMRIQLYVAMLLVQFLAKNPIGLAGPEWRCIFGPPGRERSYVPDVAFASFERYPRGDTREVLFLHAAPDLAVEILSPRQHAGRFAAKIQAYLRHGARLVWVIDPYREMIAVYSPSEDEVILRAGDVLDGGEVLPGFTVPVADILGQVYV